MRKIKRIYLHTSDSTWGSLLDINWWHQLRGFANIFRNQYTVNSGYHFIIINGDISSGRGDELVCLDGSIEIGRRIEQSGAHVSGDNAESIGVCMIGQRQKDKVPFTLNQMVSSIKLISELIYKYNLDIEDVWGHYEFYKNNHLAIEKWCPDIDMNLYRMYLKNTIENHAFWNEELIEFQKNEGFKK